MPVIPKNYADLLETRALAHVATIGPKGELQNTPVWFGWDGNHVLLSMTKTAQKYLNLQRDPRLALSIVDPKNAYRYLEIRGRVLGIEEDRGRHFVNSIFEGNKPAYQNLYKLFIESGQLIKNSATLPEISSVRQFIEPRQRMVDAGELTDFKEVETAEIIVTSKESSLCRFRLFVAMGHSFLTTYRKVSFHTVVWPLVVRQKGQVYA